MQALEHTRLCGVRVQQLEARPLLLADQPAAQRVRARGLGKRGALRHQLDTPRLVEVWVEIGVEVCPYP